MATKMTPELKANVDKLFKALRSEGVTTARNVAYGAASPTAERYVYYLSRDVSANEISLAFYAMGFDIVGMTAVGNLIIAICKRERIPYKWSGEYYDSVQVFAGVAAEPVTPAAAPDFATKLAIDAAADERANESAETSPVGGYVLETKGVTDDDFLSVGSPQSTLQDAKYLAEFIAAECLQWAEDHTATSSSGIKFRVVLNERITPAESAETSPALTAEQADYFMMVGLANSASKGYMGVPDSATFTIDEFDRFFRWNFDSMFKGYWLTDAGRDALASYEAAETAARPFQVGDRVRTTRKAFMYSAGIVGTIEEIRGSYLPIFVRWESRGGTWFDADELELVASVDDSANAEIEAMWQRVTRGILGNITRIGYVQEGDTYRFLFVVDNEDGDYTLYSFRHSGVGSAGGTGVTIPAAMFPQLASVFAKISES